MSKIGQIIEIPSTSPLFNQEIQDFETKEEEILWRASRYDYGLFDGFIVGGHDGLDQFEYGQRKGINVGGKQEPLYVIGKNQKDNQLFVGAGKDHPGLWPTLIKFETYAYECLSDDISKQDLSHQSLSVTIRKHAGGKEIEAQLWVINNALYIEFNPHENINLKNHPLYIYHNNQQKIKTL